MRIHGEGPGLLGRVLSLVAGAVLLFFLFTLSLLFFALLVAGGIMVWGYFWWKTRKLRKQMREQAPGGIVIEGEAIREHESDQRVELVEHDKR